MDKAAGKIIRAKGAKLEEPLRRGEKESQKGKGGVGKISFQDKLIGGGVVNERQCCNDLLQESLPRVEFLEGDQLSQRVFFEEEVVQELSALWKEALVVKLLGKHIAYTAIQEKLKVLWHLQARFDIMDVGNNYFMVKFDTSEDREKVIIGGPWMIQEHYLAVKEWTPQFNLSESCFGQTMVWVRLSALNLWYHDERALKVIVAVIGKSVKLDLTTSKLEHGKVARVCVEVNLALPVSHRVWIQDHWHEIKYKSLHLICSSCRCYGHMTRDCPQAAMKEIVVSLEVNLEQLDSNNLNVNLHDKISGKNQEDVAENLPQGEWKVVMGSKSRKGKAKTESSFKKIDSDMNGRNLSHI